MICKVFKRKNIPDVALNMPEEFLTDELYGISTLYADDKICCQQLYICLSAQEWCEFENQPFYKSLMNFLQRKNYLRKGENDFMWKAKDNLWKEEIGKVIEGLGDKCYETQKTAEPVAEEIVSVLINSKKSYKECLQALEIAKDKLLLTFPSK